MLKKWDHDVHIKDERGCGVCVVLLYIDSLYGSTRSVVFAISVQYTGD